MKRILIALFAAASIALTSATAFASNKGGLDGDKQSENIDVNVKFQDDTTTPTVYSVDIVWQDMDFVYVSAGSKVWNADTHEYMNQTVGAWEHDSADITVTNHSNAEIAVKVTYTPLGESGVSGEIIDGEFTIGSAVGLDYNAAELKKTARFEISGIPEDETASNLKVGTVTVAFE